jgi:hypothetical protein
MGVGGGGVLWEETAGAISVAVSLSVVVVVVVVVAVKGTGKLFANIFPIAAASRTGCFS